MTHNSDVCDTCGGSNLSRTSTKSDIKIRGQVLEYNQPISLCLDCGERFMEPRDVETMEIMVNLHMRTVNLNDLDLERAYQEN